MGESLDIKGEEESRENSIEKLTEPYKAASKGNWQMFKAYYESRPEALFYPLTINEDTAFHIAASKGDTKLIRDLLGMIVEHSRIRWALTRLTDEHGNTVLHEVATTDNVKAAAFMVNKLRESCEGNSRELEESLRVKNRLGEAPLYRAAAFGNTRMVQYLASEIKKAGGNIRGHLYRYDQITILHIAVLSRHFETALWLLKKANELGQAKEMNGLTCLHLLALMPSAFRSTSQMGSIKRFVYSCLPSIPDDEDDENEDELVSTKKTAISRMFIAIWKRLTEGLEWPKIEEIWMEKRNHAFSLKLVKLLVTQDISWKTSFLAEDTTISIGLGQGSKTEGTTEVFPLDKTLSSPETPLIMAARTGIKEIVREILKEYPEAVDHVSENQQNILHVAIMHRHKEIFNLIQNKVINIHRLASKIDYNGYNILHHVADMTYYHAACPGPAFQLQEELEWSKRVKEIMPNHYDIHRNKSNMTAEKLFEEKHKEQLNDAQKWVKKVASSCSTVAALVASVVFAAAYTVPGGTNKRGLPIFLDSSLFFVFTIMDVTSLASSFTSLVMFLSILTSPIKMKDFLDTLPQRMIIGFTFLFISVLTTMITFTVSLLLILRHMDKRWTLSLAFISALIPVVVFAVMHFRLYVQFMDTLKENFKDKVLEPLSRKYKKKRN